jgi:hypothetical protein
MNNVRGSLLKQALFIFAKPFGVLYFFLQKLLWHNWGFSGYATTIVTEQWKQGVSTTRNNGSRRNNGFVQRYKKVNESITIDTAM